jgi:hypothetical protein
VVPFTALGDLPRSSVTVDDTQPFPVLGWIQLKWVHSDLVVGNLGQVATATLGHATAAPVTGTPSSPGGHLLHPMKIGKPL